MTANMRRLRHRRILIGSKFLQKYSQDFVILLLGIKVGNKMVGDCKELRNINYSRR